jgi:hypothetical protein
MQLLQHQKSEKSIAGKTLSLKAYEEGMDLLTLFL